MDYFPRPEKNDEMTREVYVIAFEPVLGGMNAVGGFNWFWTRQDAEEAWEQIIDDQRSLLMEDAEAHYHTLREVTVLRTWEGDDVTDYVDDYVVTHNMGQPYRVWHPEFN